MVSGRKTEKGTETSAHTAKQAFILPILSYQQSDNQLKQAAPAGELPLLTEARRWSLTAQQRALSAELKMLDQELLSQPMRIELMQAQLDRTERSFNRLATRLSMLEELLGPQRRSEAERAKPEAEIAKAEMAGKHPLIRQLAEQVYELLAPGHWLNVGNILFSQLTESPLLFLVLLVFTVLLAKYIRMQKLLLESGKKLFKFRTDRFSYTFQALALTLLLAAPWPSACMRPEHR